MRNNNNQLHVYLNDEEMNLIRETSKLMGLTITDYIRLMCNLVPAYETQEERIQREQEELENYEKQHFVYYDRCETLEERMQREQEELDRFIEQDELNSFESETQSIENDFNERLESGTITDYERVLLLDGLEKTIERCEQEIVDYGLEEWVREPFYELP